MSAAAIVAVIGAGPAGLMAAERLSEAGIGVEVFDRMPTAGRKFLMAGRGGLNLTHSEERARFLSRYGSSRRWLEAPIAAFPPDALRAWAGGLGEPTFVGSSGRVFPQSFKASPLLRNWLARLAANGVAFRFRHEWQGWEGSGRLRFSTLGGAVDSVDAAATVLALGGASWPKLGSNGAWAEILARRGINIVPFRAANSGFRVAWSEGFRTRFAGQPIKTIALTYQERTVRGDAMITDYGLEGGAIYAVSAELRESAEVNGTATFAVDLKPDQTADVLQRRLSAAKPGQSRSNLLRKAAGLAPVAINLLREAVGPDLPGDTRALAGLIKAVPIATAGPQPLDRAISTAGGIPRSALDDALMLRALPGVFAAGEMLDWEAPTGGYLLQACFATGAAAAAGALAWLGR